MASVKEKAYLDKVAQLGCLICQKPAQIHHIREGQGIAMRSSNYLVIPLCQEHHTGPFSIHHSKREFENIYGSELDLLAQTIELTSNPS